MSSFLGGPVLPPVKWGNKNIYFTGVLELKRHWESASTGWVGPYEITIFVGQKCSNSGNFILFNPIVSAQLVITVVFLFYLIKMFNLNVI